MATALSEHAAAAGGGADLYRLDAERALYVWVPDGRAEAMPTLHRAEAEGRDDATVLTHDGAVVGLALTRGGPGVLGDLPTAMGAVLDRTLAHDRDRWDAAMLRALLPLLDEGVMLVTTDGEVVHYSDAMAHLVGWTEAEVREKGWTNLVYATEEAREGAQQAIAALVLGRPSEGTQRELTRKDGTTLTAGIWSRVIRRPGGGAPGLLGVVRDESHLREQRLAVARQTRLELLGEVSRRVAHDFNNLLCAIMGHAELVTASDDPDAARHAATQLDAVDKGTALVRQLLAFGAREPHPRPVDVARFAGELQQLFEARMPAGVTLELEARGAPVAEVDEDQLHHAVLNLLTNALQAVGDHGHLRLEVEEAERPAATTWRAADAPPAGTPMIRLAVIDDGPGFPAGGAARLLDAGATTRGDGHGIGLATVRGVAAQHHGALVMTEGPGAEVHLYLPRSDRPEVQLEALRRVRTGDRHTGRVWVIDDQTQILEFSRIALTAEGYEVRTFSCAADACEAAEGAVPLPDVLVVDRHLPDGDGDAALASLRARGVEAPVLWVSGLRAEGSSPFLAKPYTGTDLAHAISGVLD